MYKRLVKNLESRADYAMSALLFKFNDMKGKRLWIQLFYKKHSVFHKKDGMYKLLYVCSAQMSIDKLVGVSYNV